MHDDPKYNLKTNHTSDAVMNESENHAVPTRRELFWRTVVIITCFLAYVSLYFCRDHMYVIEETFKSEYLYPNNDRKAKYYLGIMLSIGYAAFFCGKIFMSLLTDKYLKSGITPLILAMVGAALCSFPIAIIDIKNDTLLRIFLVYLFYSGIQFCQSFGWIGMVKIIGNWTPYHIHGRVMSFVVLSFLVGDVSARTILGIMIDEYNYSWRHVILFATIITLIFVFPVIILIKNDPTQRGLPMPQENPNNVYANGDSCDYNYDYGNYGISDEDTDTTTTGNVITTKTGIRTVDKVTVVNEKNDNYNGVDTYPIIDQSLKEIIKPLLKRPLFHCIMLLSFELTIIREFFTVYIALFLHQETGVSSGVASIASSVFSLTGIFSSIFCGFWVDYIHSKHWRVSVFVICAIIMTIALTIMDILLIYNKLTFDFAVVLICIIGVTVLGPYSLFSGVLALELGGHTSAAMTCGFIDAVGKFGALLFTTFSGFVGFKILFFVASLVGILAIITSIVLFTFMKKEQNKIDQQYYRKMGV